MRSGTEGLGEVNLPPERLHIFSVDPSPVLMNSMPGYYYTNSAIKTTAFGRISEMAVHVTKKGLNSKDAFALVNYDHFNFVFSRHPAWINIIENVPKLEDGEMLKHADAPKSKFVPLRLEQKPVRLLMELIYDLNQPGEYVVCMFSGTFSTGVACLSLKMYRIFVRCE